jgi:predicted restriction endonuclease
MENDHLLELIRRIAALKRAPKTSKARFPASRAPYKPILLLTVLRRLQQRRKPYADNVISFDECQRDFGTLYAGLFGTDGALEPKVVQAFWYLGSGSPKMWDLHPQPGQTQELESMLEAKTQIKTSRKLTTLVSHASFSKADWILLNDGDIQDVLMTFLINEHFSHVGQHIARL